MSILLIVVFLVVLFGLEMLYFKLALRFNIIDHPNERSSHSLVTIRGGGIIFPIAVLIFTITFNWHALYFITGLIAISAISFADDILTLNNKIRLLVQFFAVGMLFLEWELFSLEWYWLILTTVFVVASINAYNFMDGINGITGGYSLVAVGTLLYLNQSIQFISENFLIVSGLSLFVFMFFNFRTRAKCFAGDVGSVGIAFILIYALGLLILTTQNLSYLTLLLVYGIDTVTTIVFRLIRRENLAKAHRAHFYQFLVNCKEWSHLQVTCLYMTLQILITLFMLFVLNAELLACLTAAMLITLIFIGVRFIVEGKEKLLRKKL